MKVGISECQPEISGLLIFEGLFVFCFRSRTYWNITRAFY